MQCFVPSGSLIGGRMFRSPTCSPRPSLGLTLILVIASNVITSSYPGNRFASAASRNRLTTRTESSRFVATDNYPLGDSAIKTSTSPNLAMPSTSSEGYENLPLGFERNDTSAGCDSGFSARGNGFELGLTETGANIIFGDSGSRLRRPALLTGKQTGDISRSTYQHDQLTVTSTIHMS